VTRASNRPFLLIVVEPANDRGPPQAAIGLWRIRWLRSGGIGRLRLSPSHHRPLGADRAEAARLGPPEDRSADVGGRPRLGPG
jgi:hypothetical protein